MNTKVITALSLALVLTVGAALIGLSSTDASAQSQGNYEYGYLIAVPRLESYEIDKKRWAGAEADKKYLETHVFAYETGQSEFDKHVNSLRKVNELADAGWELVDAQVGLVRRKK